LPRWSGESHAKLGSPRGSAPTASGTPSSPLHSTLECRCATCTEAASHADPRTTMRYDRARQSLDRHATYIVATFVWRLARRRRTSEPAPVGDVIGSVDLHLGPPRTRLPDYPQPPLRAPEPNSTIGPRTKNRRSIRRARRPRP